MTEQEYLNAFTQNEKEANRYTAKCLRVLAVIVAIVWLLNIVGVFTVPREVMTIAAPLSMAIFVTPTILLRFFKKKPYQMKYFIMLCCVLGITVLSAALPKHSIVAWAAPIILACHYYSKRLSWGRWRPRRSACWHRWCSPPITASGTPICCGRCPMRESAGSPGRCSP